jgi:drug/metabolite transporter (DMT)-like permease
VLALALAGISFAGPLVRLSDAHPLAIAIWRLGFSLPVVAAFVVVSRGWRQWRRLDAREALLAGGAGALLALHFWSWNTSVGLTTIAASVLLVNLQPIIVATASSLWLRESPTFTQWLGIGVAMIGAIAVVWADLGEGPIATRRALLGDLLAVVGAVTAALYYLVGRRVRQVLDLWPYVAIVYGVCLATLVAIAVVQGDVPVLRQPQRELAIFLGLALGPMLLGHTGMNWALRYLPAYVVNLTVLGEPVGATLLAAFLPGIREVPPASTLAGGALVLGGIALALPRRGAS